MQFDAKAAKQLAPGAHIIMDDYPGLRLKATTTGRAWIYRYKSPVDSKMRQIKIGAWPAMSFPAAIVKWEEFKQQRDVGADPAQLRRAGRAEVRAVVAKEKAAASAAELTVRKICSDYHAKYLLKHRKQKGADYVASLFDTMLGDLADMPVAAVTRQIAYDHLEPFLDTPVQGANYRRELGAAWDHGLDSGRIPENTPNWWRSVMRGRFKSKGKKIQGEHIGTAKRVLSQQELIQLLPWLPNFSKNVCDVLTMYLWTGQRGIEICAMQGGEVAEEQDGMWWTIPKAKTKNARYDNATDQRVPLEGRAEQVVRRRKALYGDGNLFPAKTKSKAHTSMEQKIVATAVWCAMPYSGAHPEHERPRLPVVKWAPHDLRRTARTLLSALGCPQEVAEVVIGHMKEGVVGIYDLHAYDKERRIWLRHLNERLELLARGVLPGPD